jgi:hypothetical protein
MDFRGTRIFTLKKAGNNTCISLLASYFHSGFLLAED